MGVAGQTRGQSGWWVWQGKLGDRVGGGCGRAELGESGWWEWQGRHR